MAPLKAVAMALFVGIGECAFAFYYWCNHVVGYESSPREFWRYLCWQEENYEGWQYYYHYV